MATKPRLRGSLRAPWRRFLSRRNPTPVVTGDPEGPAKASLRQGGLEHDGKDPLRHVPLKEPYAAKSGAQPPEEATPAKIVKPKDKSTKGPGEQN
jgi:hypothetical protein